MEVANGFIGHQPFRELNQYADCGLPSFLTDPFTGGVLCPDERVADLMGTR